MILWFLWKLMLFILWKTSQNGWSERALWRTLGPATPLYTGTGIACMPGFQSSDRSCLPFVLVCSLMSTLVLAWAHSKFFQLSDPESHFKSGSKNGFGQLCWNAADQEWAGKCSSWQITVACCGAIASLCISPQSCHHWPWNSLPRWVPTSTLCRNTWRE